MKTEIPDGFRLARPGNAEISDRALEDALAVAHRACDRAREEILPRYRRVRVETKGDGSPVTEADLAAERAIRSVIEDAFPEDAILGEEFGATDGNPEAVSRRRWVIDPIDGTIAFSRGIPLFTTLIALLVDDEPVMGVIDLPAVDDRIGGVRGGGVWRGDERLSTSARPDLSDALVCHGDLYCFDLAGLRSVYEAMSRAIPKLRGYTDAFGHLLVLSGAADAMIDCDLNPWDAAVTRVLTTEAGGCCWVREREGGSKLDLVFGNPEVVRAIGHFF
ncbi:MAG: histidinol phosphatase [bacterium]|nr:histidinol phosphatase [Deltaproteobacteria bacterium]MCP4903436.1 histidinol phosphatase [bacterium]